MAQQSRYTLDQEDCGSNVAAAKFVIFYFSRSVRQGNSGGPLWVHLGVGNPSEKARMTKLNQDLVAIKQANVFLFEGYTFYML